MRVTLAAALLSAAVLLAAGCSNTSHGNGQTNLPTLCAKLGGNFTEETEAPHDLYTMDEGRCGVYRFELFTSKTLRDRWLKETRPGGGNFVVGPDWVATTDDPDAAAIARRTLGGSS